jgi:hypothetical protein
MPQQVMFLREIKSYILAEWKRVLSDAELSHSDGGPPTVMQMAKTARSAQLLMLQEVLMMKGERLSKNELDYALDLFHTICATSCDFFSALKRENLCQVITQEVRAIATNQYVSMN